MVDPINIYTFGNIKYDAEPLMKTYALIEKKREVMNQAFDKYLESQAKNVNLNEIRKQDREAFQDMYNELKSLGISNKKRILNDRQARLEYEKGWNMLSNFVSQSKEEEKAKQPYLSKLASRDGREQFNMQRFGKALASHDLPMFVKDQSGAYVSNPNRKSLDMMGDYFVPESFDYTDLFQNWSAGQKKVEMPGEIIPNSKNPIGKDLARQFMVQQKAKLGYSEDAVRQIGNRAFESVSSSDKLKNFYEREFDNAKSLNQLAELDVVLKKYFPNETVSSAALLAKAKALKTAEESAENIVVTVKDQAAIEAAADRRSRRSSGGDGAPSTNVYDVIDVGMPSSDYSGTLNLSSDKVPPKLLLAMKGLGYEPGFKGVDLVVNNGTIVSAAPAGFVSFGKPKAPISREEILIGQQKAGAKINWGTKKSTKKSGSELN